MLIVFVNADSICIHDTHIILRNSVSLLCSLEKPKHSLWFVFFYALSIYIFQP